MGASIATLGKKVQKNQLEPMPRTNTDCVWNLSYTHDHPWVLTFNSIAAPVLHRNAIPLLIAARTAVILGEDALECSYCLLPMCAPVGTPSLGICTYGLDYMYVAQRILQS